MNTTYLLQVADKAKGKLTTYVAALSVFIASLPELIKDYWGQLEQSIPHLTIYHGTVTAIGLLLTIWARVRREIIPPQ